MKIVTTANVVIRAFRINDIQFQVMNTHGLPACTTFVV